MNANPTSNRQDETSDERNRRKHPRVSIDNLVAIVAIDHTGNQISQSMGRALNVSRSGLRIETPHPLQPLDTGRLSLVIVDKREKLVKTRAKMVYSCRMDNGMYSAGIQLSGMEMATKRFVVSLIQSYNHSKHSGRVKIAA